ncbi:hypothetical protein Fcan01_16422 [Folsomia candida]|uniref:Uncharacterized protein n=1 Tax=Folsomia candida TaxID=158441 RepID=A0A226DUN8_FOLCA|nr:hypothetical protein Fcan01_16422 [Folsomia candida]
MTFQLGAARPTRPLENILSLVQTNCDLQIIHDAVDAKIFQRNEPLINPTLVFNVENFDFTVTTDVFKARPGPCRMALFFINFLTYTQIRWPERESYYLPSLIETVKDKQFHFIHYKHKIILTEKNIYTIILANSENSNVFDNNSKIFSEMIYNFGVAYISRNLKLVKLCIKTFDTSENVKCLIDMNDICKLFTELVPLTPRFWEISPSLEPFNGANHLKLINAKVSPNPFNQRGNPYSLAQVVFRRANVTVITGNVCNDMKTACGSVNLLTMRHVFAKSVPVTWTGYEFLSCFKETYISFEFYVNPFKKEVWIALFISIVTVFTLITLFIKFLYDRKISFCPWLFVLSTLFEEPGAISDKKLEAHFMFRFVLGSWCLVSVILTNCYNGLMITDLNAPLGSIRPERFRDLNCGHFGSAGGGGPISLQQFEKQADLPSLKWYNLAMLSHTYQYPLDGSYKNFRNPYESKDCFKLLSPAEQHPRYRVQYCQFFNFLISEYSKFSRGSDFLNDKKVVPRGADLLYLNLLHPRHGHFPSGLDYSRKEYSLDEINHKVEKEVVDCSQKNVFVTRDKDFRVQYKFLREKYSSKEFYKGKDVLNSKPIALEFLNEGSSKVPRYFEGLIETGIYARIEEEIETRQVLDRIRGKKRVVQDETKSFGLNGAIFTLFVLCGFVILGALTSFLCECRAHLVKCFTSFHAHIVQFFRTVYCAMNKFIEHIKTLI